MRLGHWQSFLLLSASLGCISFGVRLSTFSSCNQSHVLQFSTVYSTKLLRAWSHWPTVSDRMIVPVATRSSPLLSWLIISSIAYEMSRALYSIVLDWLLFGPSTVVSCCGQRQLKLYLPYRSLLHCTRGSGSTCLRSLFIFSTCRSCISIFVSYGIASYRT